MNQPNKSEPKISMVKALIFIIFSFISFYLYKNIGKLFFDESILLKLGLIALLTLSTILITNAISAWLNNTSNKNIAENLSRFSESFTKQKFIILFFLLLSWFATSEGLLAIIKEQSGLEAYEDIKITIRFYVFVLTVAMAHLVRGWLSPGSSILKILMAFIGWLMLAIFSVSFSFAFFWTILESSTQLTNQVESKIQIAEQSALKIQQSLSEVESLVASMANDSAYKALKEKGLRKDDNGQVNKVANWGGDTCGAFTEIKAGPRSRLRERVEASLRLNQAHLSSKATEIKSDIQLLNQLLESTRSIQNQNLNQIDTESEWGKQITKLNQVLASLITRYSVLTNGAQIRQMKTSFKSYGQKFSNFDKNFKDSNRSFSCYDPDLANQFNSSLDSLESLPVIDPLVIDNFFGAKATKEALSRFYDFIFRKIDSLASEKEVVNLNPNSKEDQAMVRTGVNNAITKTNQSQSNIVSTSESNNNRDLIPLLIAIGIDFILFVMMFTDPRSSRLNVFEDKMKGSSKDNPLGNLDLYERAMKDSPGFVRFSKYLVHLYGEEYIAIPKNRGGHNRAMYGFMTMLRDTGVAGQELAMESWWGRKTHKKIAEQHPKLAEESDGAGYFIYKLAPGTFTDIMMRLINEARRAPVSQPTERDDESDDY